MNKHPEIAALSRHLQANLQTLSGKVFSGVKPRFNPALLIPVAAIIGATALLTISPKARKSILLKVAMLVSTHLLQEQNEQMERESGAEPYDPGKD